MNIMTRNKKALEIKRSKKKKLSDFQRKRKTKIIEFDQNFTCSVKSLAVNRNKIIKLKSRFFNTKMLMFAKLSLMSCIYELIKVYCFFDKKIKEMHEK